MLRNTPLMLWYLSLLVILFISLNYFFNLLSWLNISIATIITYNSLDDIRITAEIIQVVVVLITEASSKRILVVLTWYLLAFEILSLIMLIHANKILLLCDFLASAVNRLLLFIFNIRCKYWLSLFNNSYD